MKLLRCSLLQKRYFTKGLLRLMRSGKSGVWKVPVLILAKSNDQEAGMNGLCKICNAIHNRAEYPSGESVAWLDAQTVTPPNKIGRDEAGRYLFSGIINCSIYC